MQKRQKKWKEWRITPYRLIHVVDNRFKNGLRQKKVLRTCGAPSFIVRGKDVHQARLNAMTISAVAKLPTWHLKIEEI